MHDEQRRGDKQEGKLDRLGHAAEDRGERDRDEQRHDLLFLFRTGGCVEGQRDAGTSEDFGESGCGETRFGYQRLERGGRGRDLGQAGRPVGVQAAGNDRVVIVERGVQNVVQAERDQQAFEQDENPDAQRARALNESLKGQHTKLHLRPYERRDQRDRNHDEKADHEYEGGAVERTQPVGQFGVIKLVVQPDNNARNSQRADHAHVERLDVGDHRKAARAADLGGKVHAECCAPLGEHRAQEVVEGQIEDKRLHAAARILLLCHADWQRHRKQQRKLIEHRPAALQDHVPALVEQAIRFGQIAHDGLGRE